MSDTPPPDVPANAAGSSTDKAVTDEALPPDAPEVPAAPAVLATPTVTEVPKPQPPQPLSSHPISGGDLSMKDVKAKKAPATPREAPLPEADRPTLDIAEVRELDAALERGKQDKAKGKTEDDSPYALQGLGVNDPEQQAVHRAWLMGMRS